MPRLAAASLAAALLAATATAASAGTFVSIGVGSTPTVQGDLKMETTAEPSDVANRRAGLGWSFGRLAIEATAARYALGSGHATVASAHGKLSFPLHGGGGFGAYARAGVERAWLSNLDPRLGDSADGLVGGLGLEYKLSAPVLGQAAIWAEVSQDQLTFADESKGGARMFTLGASLGL